MRRLNLFIALLALALPVSGLMLAAPAMAYNISTVYKDCEANGQLTRHYPQAELKAALNAMPSEVAEYSACADIIRQALIGASSHGGGHNGTSGSTLAGGGHGSGGGPGGGSASGYGSTGGSSTNDGRSAGGGNGNAVRLAGTDIRPGSTGTGAAASSLPTALVIVLILLALTALSGGAVAIRRRVIARHGT